MDPNGQGHRGSRGGEPLITTTICSRVHLDAVGAGESADGERDCVCHLLPPNSSCESCHNDELALVAVVNQVALVLCEQLVELEKEAGEGTDEVRGRELHKSHDDGQTQRVSVRHRLHQTWELLL